MHRDQLAALVRAHQAELYRYLRYLGAQPAAAQDLVQDLFLAAFKHPTPPEPGTPGCAAWLRGIGRNLFLQWCRRNRTSPVRADSDAVERAEADWSAVFLREGDGFDYLDALRQCLDTLPPEQRDALARRYEQRQSRAEMARAARLSEQGVKSLLRRIRAALADCVRRRLKLEGAVRR